MLIVRNNIIPVATWMSFVALAFATATEIRNINKPDTHVITGKHSSEF